MPLFVKGQKHTCWNQPAYNFYHFPEEHRKGWMKFWESMEGKEDKILDFAKKSDIKSPEEWFESLHWFLFDLFSGSSSLMKHAAASSFQDYVKNVADNHSKNPKVKSWYTARGITVDGFIQSMLAAAEIKDVQQAVSYINARVPNLGFYLYSEFILSKTEGKSEIRHVASNKNKEAYDLECQALGHSPLISIKEGSTIKHRLIGGVTFKVEEVGEDSVVVRNPEGKLTVFEDVWNIEL